MSHTSFVGPAGVKTFMAISLKHGIALYAKTGMKPGRSWTPTAMLKQAGDITGKTFKRGQYKEAIEALEAWLIVNGTNGHDGPVAPIVIRDSGAMKGEKE